MKCCTFKMCQYRPIEEWLVEHPKIKIKSLIILNYGVNVQYAYSVKCDIFENIISKGIEYDCISCEC